MRYVALVLCLISVSECARILGIFHLPGKSHYAAGNTMMKILAERGHDVTLISPFKEKNPPKNFRDVVLTPEAPKEKFDFFNFNVHPLLQSYIYSVQTSPILNATLSHPEFKRFLESKQKFDLVLMEYFFSDALKYLGVYFNAPVIVYSALDANSWINPSVANPMPVSYVQDLLASSDVLSFPSRLERTFMYVCNSLIRNFLYLPIQDKLVKEHFPGAPDIDEYFNNAALMLLNADVSVNAPIPKVPAMVDIGGFHIKPTKPLPKDLQDVLDKAVNGVVYFSMGSNLQSAQMPKKTLAALLAAFSKLKETVLWKWEEDNLPGKPDNVIIRKWLPQNDVFAHKNVKLFITHGGIFSTMEAVYHGIPCLAFPIFGDQVLNAQRASETGYARWMKFHEITEEKVLSEIDEILNNPKYSENVKARSRIMLDKPISPADRLVFWVEYVIRHKGADHLRVAGLELTWYQYLLVDVIFFVAICSVMFVLFVKYVLCYLFSICRKSNSKLKTQ
ncbi:hypothetical protein HHI36_009224 [Cryptolaemus montrouzieri]|uniref:UDP-glucuronosyltransferase n=1 Tax=Cryptolaemus montrouzieri TaxID=559131 RepID=A0ABD2MV32_9CUCU